MDEAAAPSAPAKGFSAPVSSDTLVAFALLVAGAVVFLWYAPASYQIFLALPYLHTVNREIFSD